MPQVVKSANVSNLDARPVILNGSFTNNSSLVHTVVKPVAVADTDELSDVSLLMVLSSGVGMHSLVLSNSALGASGAVSFGIFNGPDKVTIGSTTYTPYQVISATGITAAAPMFAAANGTELLTVNTAGKRLWELAGLTSDPLCQLVIGFTVTTVYGTPVAGNVALRCIYTPAGA